MPALPHTPKHNDAGESSWLLDENLSPALVQGSLQNLNIADSPLHTTMSRAGKSIKSRPSWGSAALLDTTHTGNMSKMRLLAGLEVNDENKPPVSRKGPVATGSGARPRFSLFAKPGVPTHLMSKKIAQQEVENDEEDDLTIGGLPDSSVLASSSAALDASSVDTDDEYIREALLGHRSSARQSTGGPTPVESKESTEHTARQLTELRRMNAVFESFETTLRGSAGQINAFAKRVQETDDLLNVYISLLRQTDKTQQLLQDQDWKGTSEDATAHALSVALAERETERLQAEAREREEQAEREQLEAEMRAQEQQRREAEDARRGAGARGRGRAVSGTARGTARGAASAATRGRAVSGRTASTNEPARTTPPTASTRGSASSARGRSASATGRGTARPSAIPTRATSGSAGLGGQYANVKSSGYGPR